MTRDTADFAEGAVAVAQPLVNSNLTFVTECRRRFFAVAFKSCRMTAQGRRYVHENIKTAVLLTDILCVVAVPTWFSTSQSAVSLSNSQQTDSLFGSQL